MTVSSAALTWLSRCDRGLLERAECHKTADRHFTAERISKAVIYSSKYAKVFIMTALTWDRGTKQHHISVQQKLKFIHYVYILRLVNMPVLFHLPPLISGENFGYLRIALQSHRSYLACFKHSEIVISTASAMYFMNDNRFLHISYCLWLRTLDWWYSWHTVLFHLPDAGFFSPL